MSDLLLNLANFTCFACKRKERDTRTWQPFNGHEVVRQHCGLRCFKIYRLLYGSSTAARFEAALERVQAALASSPAQCQLAELQRREGYLTAGLARARRHEEERRLVTEQKAQAHLAAKGVSNE